MLMYYYYCGVFQQSYLGNRAMPNATQQHTPSPTKLYTTFVSCFFYFLFWKMARKPKALCVYLGTHICLGWHAAMMDKPYTRSLGCSFFASSFGCSLVFILLFQFVRVVFFSLFSFSSGVHHLAQPASLTVTPKMICFRRLFSLPFASFLPRWNFKNTHHFVLWSWNRARAAKRINIEIHLFGPLCVFIMRVCVLVVDGQ